MRKIKTTIHFENLLDDLSPEFVLEINDILTAYYEAGVEDMRQAAIKECLKLAKSESYYSDNLADECAEEIEKINLKEAK